MSKHRKTNSKLTIQIDPSIIRFTHSRIRPFFTGCNKRVEETLEELLDGVIVVDDLPLITVIENEGNYFSLNNRRLYVLKKLREAEMLKNGTVAVYLKPALDRERTRYTVQNCSISAKIMKEFEKPETGSTANIEDAMMEVAPELDGDKQAANIDFDGFESQDESGLKHLDIALSTISFNNDKSGPVCAEEPEPANQQSTLSSTTKLERGKGKRRAANKHKNEGKVDSRTLSAAGDSQNDDAVVGANDSLFSAKEIEQQVKSLAKLVSKRKNKAVISQLDEWEISGMINSSQRDMICDRIGLK